MRTISHNSCRVTRPALSPSLWCICLSTQLGNLSSTNEYRRRAFLIANDTICLLCTLVVIPGSALVLSVKVDIGSTGRYGTVDQCGLSAVCTARVMHICDSPFAQFTVPSVTSAVVDACLVEYDGISAGDEVWYERIIELCSPTPKGNRYKYVGSLLLCGSVPISKTISFVLYTVCFELTCPVPTV